MVDKYITWSIIQQSISISKLTGEQVDPDYMLIYEYLKTSIPKLWKKRLYYRYGKVLYIRSDNHITLEWNKHVEISNKLGYVIRSKIVEDYILFAFNEEIIINFKILKRYI
jgi:hypothetical protein